MAVVQGRTQAVGLGKESVTGTAVAPTHWIPQQELTIEDKKTVITDDSAYGTRFEALAVDKAMENAEGNLNGVIYDRTFGKIVHAALGSVATVTHPTATGVKNHTFTTANTLPSYTIAKYDGNEQVRHAYGMLNQLEISIKKGAYASYTSSWLARKGTSTANTVALSTENRFRPQDVKVYIASTVAGLDSATATKFSELTFTYNNNLITDPTLGSIAPDYYPGVAQSSISFSRLYVDTTIKDMVFGTTPMALRIAMINTDVSIGTGTPTNPGIVITFQPGYFAEWSRDGGLNDLKTENISYTPIFSTSTSKQFDIVMTNLEASY